MTAVIMDTRNIAATLRQHLQQEIMTFSRQYNQTPGLVILGMAEDQSTIDIMRIVGRNAPDIGVRYSGQLLASNIKAAELRRQIEGLNADPNVHAISLQAPIPKHLDMDEIGSWIVPEKDVEAMNPIHMGRTHMGRPFLASPPALSTMKLLSLYNINPAGRHVVIVGRNMEIGRPLASLMTKADATVTVCHSITSNLQAHTRQAEILVTAAGQPGLIKAEMVRPGAVVIDYGINYVSKAQVVGDTDFERVVSVAGAITPMPGGTGPLTIICLIENVLKAARFQLSQERQTNKPLVEPEQSFQFRSNSPEAEMRPGLLAPRTDLMVNTASVPKNGYYN